MIHYDVTQGEEEWFRLRLGVPTASNANRILTPKTGRLSAQATGYINELVGENLSLVTPNGIENATTRAMDHGKYLEEEARRFFTLHHKCDVQNGGFCLTEDRRFGCSPDLIVGLQPEEEFHTDSEGNQFVHATCEAAGELKCPFKAGVQTGYVLAGTLPDEHKWQCHFHLLVTGADRVHYLAYHPGIAPLLVVVEPGPDTRLLAEALEEFHARYVATLNRVREMSA